MNCFHRLFVLLLVLMPLLAPGRCLAAGRNLLLVIADDLGADSLAMLNLDPSARQAPTPTLEMLRSKGVLFRRCYSHPTCSPTRASLLTGRYPFRHGIGYAIANPSDPQLRAEEWTLPKAIGPGYRHAQLGKWHLSYGNDDPRAIAGWSHFAGSIAGAIPNYDRWPKVVDGTLTAGYSTYATTDCVDDARTWISGQGTNRWLLWLAFNAAHTPLHKPPRNLHSYDALPDSAAVAQTNPRPYFEAMVESLDTELGRLLEAVDLSETTVVFVGDNGSTGAVIQPPYSSSRAKGTLYEGGLRVPMIIAGADVVSPGRTSDAVLHLTDVYATLLDLAGVPPDQWAKAGSRIDSRSFAAIARNEPFSPSLAGVLSENFSSAIPDDVAGRMAVDARYKLIQFKTGTMEFYDLLADPLEQTNRIALIAGDAGATEAVTRLKGWLATWAEPPVLTAAGMEAGGFRVSAQQPMGITLSLERSGRPDGGWTSVVGAVRTVEADRVTWLDPDGGGEAYYRVVTMVP